MCFLTALLLQITLVPFQTIDLDKGVTPLEILYADDSLLYYQDFQGELGPFVGYNYKSNSYFGNLKYGRGPLEIETDTPPLGIYTNGLFYITDKTQNKVVVYDKKLNPIDEYISDAELIQLSYKSDDSEISLSMSPSQPLISSTRNGIQMAPRVTDPYLQKIELGYIMRQFQAQTLDSWFFGVLRFTDYTIIFSPESNELRSFRLNLLDDIPDPKNYIMESPRVTDYAQGPLDITVRKQNNDYILYVLFSPEPRSKINFFVKYFSKDESFVDEWSHSSTIFKFVLNMNEGEARLVETYHTSIPVSSIYFHDNHLLALTYLNLETPQLLFFEIE